MPAMIEWMTGIAGLALGAALTGGFFLRRNIALEKEITALTARADSERAGLESQFRVLAQSILDSNSESFMRLAAEKLKQAQNDGAYDLEKRQKAISDLVEPVRKQLETLGSTVEQIKGTDQALRADLQLLSRETARLVGALRDPAAQGRWGEFILEGLLEKSGLMRGVHYDTQVSFQTDGNRRRPDAVIHLKDGFHIIIDAKAPINALTDRLAQDLMPEEIATLTGDMARQVREHVRTLGGKNYWEGLESSPDFTVMFLPSEHVFSMALRADPGLVDFASERNVVIASPTLLMSLLRVVAMSWRQVELAQNAQAISAQGAEVYKRLVAFADHLDGIGKGLGRAVDGYNRAVGSLQTSVLPGARKLKDLHVQTAGKELPAPEPIETMLRDLNIKDGQMKETALIEE